MMVLVDLVELAKKVNNASTENAFASPSVETESVGMMDAEAAAVIVITVSKVFAFDGLSILTDCSLSAFCKVETQFFHPMELMP